MSLIKGIHHVCLKCANEEEYKEVVHFYHEILELEKAICSGLEMQYWKCSQKAEKRQRQESSGILHLQPRM